MTIKSTKTPFHLEMSEAKNVRVINVHTINAATINVNVEVLSDN